MRSKSLVALVALLAVLAGYFFLVEQRSHHSERDARRASSRMLPYGPVDVDRIWLLNPYGDSIEMRRRPDGWEVTYPVADDGDGPAIEMLLRQVVPGQKLAEYEDIGSLADYGLDAPYASLILHSGRYGRTDTVHIGDQTPTSPRAYARLGGSRTVVVTRDLARNVMQKTLFHLRDKNFVHLPSREIERLVIREPGSRLELIRSGAEWLLGGTALRADRGLIEPYLTQLTDAIVYEFAAEKAADSAAFGIGDPPRELLLYTPGRTVRFSFGTRAGDFVPVVRSGRGKVMMLEARLIDPFTWVRDHVLVMSLSTAKPGEVVSLRWESPDTTLSLSLAGDRWAAAGPGPIPVDDNAVRYLLMLLRSTRYESLVEDPAAAAELIARSRPTRIVLGGRGGETLDVITLAGPPGGPPLGSSLTVGNAGRLAGGSLAEIERAFSVIGRR